MEQLFKTWTFYLASAIEAGAAIVIALAVVEALIRSALIFVRPNSQPHQAKELIRLHLGRWLALALEFEVAADILRTAIAPTWNEIGQLAAIVVLRTVLNFFLQREIDQAAERDLESSAPSAPTEVPRAA